MIDLGNPSLMHKCDGCLGTGVIFWREPARAGQPGFPIWAKCPDCFGIGFWGCDPGPGIVRMHPQKTAQAVLNGSKTSKAKLKEKRV